MKANPYIEGKKLRQQQLRELIREAGEIAHDKLVAAANWHIGIREKTANEYLRAMAALGLIVWNGEKRTWKVKAE